MKIKGIIAIIIIIVLTIIATNCLKDPCPDKPIYYLFTKEELSYLFINKDSVMLLQEKLTKEDFIKDYYIEHDTVNYISENSDTIPFVNENFEMPDHELCANNKSMIGISSCKPLKNCFVKSLSYKIKKTIVPNTPIISTINIELDDRECSLDYKLNDTVLLKYNFINEPIDTTGDTYFIASIDSTTINNIRIDNCIKFLFLNKFRIETLKLYYCNKYGFIKITKNQKNEIKKLL